jgi:predicted DNA-binding protein (MmcQ/YjbR family)
MPSDVKKVQAELRALALGLPGATEEFPWGERVVKVDRKVFVFLGRDEPHAGWGMSVKLPQSGAAALDQPFAEPTGYGLGKSGWVTASFEPGERPPLELLRGWILESYRAIAPKKRLAELDGAAPAKPAKARRKRSR